MTLKTLFQLPLIHMNKLVFILENVVNYYRAAHPGISSDARFRTPTIPIAFLTKIYKFSVIFVFYECVF